MTLKIISDEDRKENAYDVLREPMVYDEEELKVLNQMYNPQEAKELALHLIWCIENPTEASIFGGDEWFREVANDITYELRENNYDG